MEFKVKVDDMVFHEVKSQSWDPFLVTLLFSFVLHSTLSSLMALAIVTQSFSLNLENNFNFYFFIKKILYNSFLYLFLCQLNIFFILILFFFLFPIFCHFILPTNSFFLFLTFCQLYYYYRVYWLLGSYSATQYMGKHVAPQGNHFFPRKTCVFRASAVRAILYFFLKFFLYVEN